jgi:hypothetical protein
VACVTISDIKLMRSQSGAPVIKIPVQL